MENKLVEIGGVDEIALSFTLGEIEDFLSNNGFKTIKNIKRASYAFPTYVIVARRIR